MRRGYKRATEDAMFVDVMLGIAALSGGFTFALVGGFLPKRIIDMLDRLR